MEELTALPTNDNTKTRSPLPQIVMRYGAAGLPPGLSQTEGSDVFSRSQFGKILLLLRFVSGNENPLKRQTAVSKKHMNRVVSG